MTFLCYVCIFTNPNMCCFQSWASVCFFLSLFVRTHKLDPHILISFCRNSEYFQVWIEFAFQYYWISYIDMWWFLALYNIMELRRHDLVRAFFKSRMTHDKPQSGNPKWCRLLMTSLGSGVSTLVGVYICSPCEYFFSLKYVWNFILQLTSRTFRRKLKLSAILINCA
jgi:hypothetical protein